MINDAGLNDAGLNDVGLDAVQVLRRVGIACRQERAARNNKLIMAACWADCYPADSIDPYQLRIPGGDRPIRPGGDGTPAIAGFAVAEFGTELGWSIGTTQRFIADALDLRHRLPRLWARLCGNEIDGYQAQKIAQETRHLTREQAAQVDAAVADYLGRAGWAQVLRLLEAKIIEVDAERIARLAEQHRTQTGVWIGQGTEHGTKTLFVRGDAPDVIWFEAMTARFAELLARRGDARTRDQRRAAAVGILANPLYALRLLTQDTAPSLFDPDPEDADEPEEEPPDQTPGDEGLQPAQGPEPVEGPPAPTPTVDHPPRFPRIDDDRTLARAAIQAIGQLDPATLKPDATLYVHIAIETLQHGLGVARVEDIGPMVTTLVADWLRDCRITVKPVIDLPVDLTPVDGYEIPRRMRERMFLRRPTSTFPYSASTGRRLDLDHSNPYQHGRPGQTPMPRS